jgi:multidrug efflux system membrane fusion protein
MREVPYEITAPGTVEPIRAVAVTSQVSGVVTSVRFNEGDEVREGQVLFTIDSRPYRNALQQAEAALARDVVQLTNAQRQVDRYQSLAKSEYVTDEQYQQLKTTADGLSASLKADSAALDNARLNLEYTTIRAPLSGRTGSLLIKEGNLVRAPGSGPLVMLNQTRPIQVRFAVPANFLPEIRRRQANNLRVQVVPGDVPTPITGELAFVDNTVDTTTGTILLKGRFDNATGVLWPGQFVTATLRLYVEQALVVPQPAVMLGEGTSFVFVVGPDDKVTTRPVQVGRQVGDFVMVTRGLDPGESVVTDGQLRLTQGARVEIRDPNQPDAPPAAEGQQPGARGRRQGGETAGPGQPNQNGGRSAPRDSAAKGRETAS